VAIVSRFKHGGVEYPLVAATTNTLLRDADPALHFALDFFESILNTYVGERLLAQAALEGLRFPSAVEKKIHFEPSPFLLTDQMVFPILCLHRSEDEWKDGNTSFNSNASVWEWDYVLPPLTPRQIEQLNPIFRSVAVVISTFAMQPFDPDFEDGATLRALSGIVKMTAGPVSYGRFEQVSEQGQWWRAVGGKILVEEQAGNAEGVFEPFAGVNAKIDLTLPNEEPVVDFVAINTPEEIAIETVSPISGPAAGASPFTIDGTGFRPGALYRVLVGGAYASSVVCIHPTRIVGLTPEYTASVPFTADVQIIGPDGESSNTLAGAFLFTA
jgi:hypothetical protein